ncbi:hypothetical protein HOG48_02525 [Candidatus Peregrinibacteria bacterium]|jgi:DNA polymerase I|nr:hypothetical protein [Candidatus Peregrinibacteria bacterium]
MKKFLIVDGMALIFRGFYAIRYEMRTSEGLPTNAIYGFTSMLLTALLNEKPEYVAMTFDLEGPTFRKEEYSEYKAQREKAPDELYAQIPWCKEIVKAFDIPIFEKPGFEADDLIGTLTHKAAGRNVLSMILTGDMDLLQLVNDQIRVIAPQNGGAEAKIYNRDAVIEKWGITPEQVPCYKGLRGDSSDNIPGVMGIGEKTAVKLLTEFGSVEGIYENLDKITGSVHDKLEKDRKMAFLSKRLATILTDVEVEFNLDECETHQFDKAHVVELFDNLQFGPTLRRKLTGIKTQGEMDEEKKAEEMQPSLF